MLTLWKLVTQFICHIDVNIAFYVCIAQVFCACRVERNLDFGSLYLFFLGIFGGDKIVEFAQCCKLIILFYLYLCNIALGDSCHQRIK